ncbi:ATP-binding protein [Leifsonia shinshuensis]
MQNEVTWRHGHLMWTRSGVVWAIWRLRPLPYGFAEFGEKDKIRLQHQELLQAIRGEALLMGFTARLDPAGIVERMMHGVQMDKAPEHLEEVNRSLDELESIQMSERAYWFAVPLFQGNGAALLSSQMKAGYGRFRDSLGLRRLAPGMQELASALSAAAVIERAIPSMFEPQRATALQQLWLYEHAATRGLDFDLSAPPAQDDLFEGSWASGSAFGDPWFDEGGKSDLPPKKAPIVNPFKHRFLKVQSPHRDEPSYQVMMAVTGTPAGGWVFPGAEWISWVDQFPLDVDWAIRLDVTDAATAKRANQKAEAALDDQYQQQFGNSAITGGTTDLDRNAQMLAEYHQRLSLDEREVEVQFTTIFAVGAADADTARDLGRIVASTYGEQSIILEPVVGEQENLWWSMLPGQPTPSIVRQLAQLTTSRDLSTTLPLITFELGDNDGIWMGDNQSTGRALPFFLNLYGATQSNMSGSFAVLGDLGGGKSVAMKKIAGSAVDRGGRLVCIDRSEPMEYAVFARSLAPESTTILEILKPTYSLDPLRVFGGETGARMTQSLFAALLKIDPMSPRGAFLSSLLEQRFLTENGIDSLGALRRHIGASKHERAAELAELIDVIATKDLGRVFFDETLPPVSLNARATVFCTRGLDLPSEEEMANAHLFERMPVEKTFGRAIYTLLAQVGRAICFASDREFALFLVDEVGPITQFSEGLAEVKRFVQEGRKSAAAIGMGGQVRAHLGPKELSGLIPTKFVFRTTNKALAQENIEWLGWNPTEEKVKQVQNLSPRDPRHPRQEVPENRRGECIVRDPMGRVGPARVRLPLTPTRQKAVLTSPPRETEPTPELV